MSIETAPWMTRHLSRLRPALLSLAIVLAACVDDEPAAPLLPETIRGTAQPALTDCGGLRLDPARSQRALESAISTLQLTGAQAAIVLCGAEWIGAAGMADVAAGRRMTPATPYRGGSTTKSFTTVLLLQLAQEGALSLDDKLAKWFPAVPRANDVTVRMLLGNRSGYYNYTDDPQWRAVFIAQPNRTWLPEELVAIGVRRPLLFEPGTGFAYSNTNFVLAALVAQAVTNKSYATLLRERILTPLALSSTFLPPGEPTPGTLARGYTWGVRSDGTIDDTYTSAPARDATFLGNYSHGWAAGALISTVRDEAVFIRALLRGGLLSPSALLAMLPYDSSPSFLGGQYGLGMMRLPTGLGTYAYGHGGQTFGYLTWMLDIPESDLTIVVNINDDYRGVTSLSRLTDLVASSLAPP